MVFSIAVTGWFSAKPRTTSGIDLVGTNAELIKGRKISGYEKAVAPSIGLAVSPAITATQVTASVNIARMPTTASPDRMLPSERKPTLTPAYRQSTTETPLEPTQGPTRPHTQAVHA